MWLLDELKKRRDNREKAIIYRDSEITYKDLWDLSEHFVRFILTKTDGSEPIVIYGNKDMEIIAVMIAALKTGHSYVPVDITFPPERLMEIAEITETKLIFNFSNMNLETDISVNSDIIKSIIQENGDSEDISEDHYVKDSDDCYILFTSGSTGNPKGVPITKKNIINFVDWFDKQGRVDEGLVALNQVSYSFDVSVIQLYFYLPLGVPIFSVDKPMIDNFGELFEYLKSSDLSVWVSTPSFLEMCSAYDIFNRELLPKLKKIILAGEVLSKKLVSVLWDKFPGVEVINGYGPTEATVLLSSCTITRDMIEDDENMLPIGRLIEDAVFYLEKNESTKTDDYDSGELIITTESLSKGYFKNQKMTDKNFLIKDERVFYRTGDIVYIKNGLLYYVGRTDSQIKLNGYRIELGDIQENINKIDFVSNNIVLPSYKDGRVAYIASFVVLSKDLGLSSLKVSMEIRKNLKGLIQSYMIPKKIVILDKFPINTNGKIDRKKLTEEYL